MIVSLIIDMLFSVIILIMAFGVFNGLIYDYKLLSSLSHLLNKNIKAKLMGGSLDLSFISSLIHGSKILSVYLDEPEYGSTFTEGEKATVKLSMSVMGKKEIMLNMRVQVNGKLDSYITNKRMNIIIE